MAIAKQVIKKVAAVKSSLSSDMLKQLANAADQLYSLREKRYKLQNEAAKLEEKESELREFIIKSLPKSQAEGVTGRIAHAEIKSKRKPRVKDWKKFYAYILKTKDFSLMQRRINDAAVEERWEKKKVVPGTEAFNAITVSVTKK